MTRQRAKLNHVRDPAGSLTRGARVLNSKDIAAHPAPPRKGNGKGQRRVTRSPAGSNVGRGTELSNKRKQPPPCLWVHWGTQSENHSSGPTPAAEDRRPRERRNSTLSLTPFPGKASSRLHSRFLASPCSPIPSSGFQ